MIGAYVTAGARMHLYRYLDKLGERALYCDTDSLLYIQSEGGPRLVECGDRLGDMTNELGDGEYIEEFVSGGPKNYAYKACNGDTTRTVCKVRGITLNYTAMKIVNFNVIREMVLKGTPETVTVHTDKKIKRKRAGGGGTCVALVSEPEDKIYRLSFHKRRCLANNTSLPFG